MILMIMKSTCIMMSQIGQTVIPGIIYVKTFSTDVDVIITCIMVSQIGQAVIPGIIYVKTLSTECLNIDYPWYHSLYRLIMILVIMTSTSVLNVLT
jgi:hypothetical protein